MTRLFFTNAAMTAEKIPIDTDPGIDDTLAAIFASFSGDPEVNGFTTDPKNVETWLATRSALHLLMVYPLVNDGVEHHENFQPPRVICA